MSLFIRIPTIAFLLLATLRPFAASYASEADSSATLAPGSIKLVLQTLPSPIATDIRAQVMRAQIQKFSLHYPEYKLEPFSFPGLEGMAMDQGPLMAIATGVPAHGMYVNFRQSSSYINHGFLAPLEILLARLNSSDPRTRMSDGNGNWLADPDAAEVAAALAQLRERIVAAAWPVLYREADTPHEGVPPGKHVWALPYNALARALLYRKDVFAEAGLDPERPPRDWDEFLSFARQIRAVPGKYGFAYSIGPYVSWSAYSFMVSNGVRYMEQDENGRWHAAFNTRAAAEAIYYLLQLTREPFTTAGGDTLSGACFAPLGGSRDIDLKWQRGEVGMYFTYLSFDRGLDINPAMVGIAPVPMAPGGDGASELNCGSTGVFAGATPEQQLGVMRYIWFQGSDEAEQERVRMFVDAGYGTFVEPNLLAKFGYDDILQQIPEDWKTTVEKAMRNGVPEPYGKNTQSLYEYVSEPMNWALERPDLLNLPPEQALQRIEEQLDKAVFRVNKFLLSELSPAEWQQRRIAGGAVLIFIVIIFVLSIRWVWRAFSLQERLMGDLPPFRSMRYAYLMILPGLLLVLFIAYLPLLLGVPLALLDYQLVLKSGFVGIDNFATILWDGRFWLSLLRTFYYALLVVGLGFWPPILVAILLDEVPSQALKYLFRTIFYLPAIVSGIIMVFLWRQFYEPSETGFLNQIIMSVNHLGPVAGITLKLVLLGCWLSLVGFIFACAVKLKELSWPVRGAIALFALALLGATLWPLLRAWIGPDELTITARQLDPAKVKGWSGLATYLAGLWGPFKLKPLGWIEDPGMAMFSVVLPMVWASAGPGCIIYLAALKTVPEDLIEAATIDGAGIIQRISYITLPRIKFLILIQLMGALIGALKGGTDFIMVMTGGGPNGATRTLGLDIFQRAWMELKFSTGAAMGWILGAVVIILTCQQLRRMSRATFTNAAQIAANKEL